MATWRSNVQVQQQAGAANADCRDIDVQTCWQDATVHPHIHGNSNVSVFNLGPGVVILLQTWHKLQQERRDVAHQASPVVW